LAADLSNKKADYISSVLAASAALLEIAITADELSAFRTDNAFGSGGANAITDDDCVGGNGHVTAAQVEAVMQVVAAVSTAMTAARRTTLRQANAQPNK
jgi:hypothetical protein